MSERHTGIKNRIIAVLAAGCLAYFCCFWMGTDREAVLEAYEKKAEDAMLADTEILAHNGQIRRMDGQEEELKTLYNDKPVLLYFWMPWSDDSKKGLPLVENIYRIYGQDVHVVALVVGSAGDEAASFWQYHECAMPFYTGELTVADDYNVYEVPQFVMIRKGGAIADRHIGLMTERELAYMVEKGMQP